MHYSINIWQLGISTTVMYKTHPFFFSLHTKKYNTILKDQILKGKNTNFS